MMPDKISSRQDMLAPALRRTISFRDALLFLYRRRGLMFALFLVVFLAVALATWLTPFTYVAYAKILLKKERATTLISPNEDANLTMKAQGTTEILNSEIEILKSSALLSAVARNTGLEQLEIAAAGSPPEGGPIHLMRAAAKLEKNLSIELIPKSNIIQVSYASPEPVLAAEVVNELCRRYVDRHLQVHESIGIYAFFQKQAQALYDTVQSVEAALKEFETENGLIAPEQQRALALQQLAQNEAKLSVVRAGRQEEAQKVKFLKQQLAQEPQRIQTQARNAYNTVVTSLKNEVDSLMTSFAPSRQNELQMPGKESAIPHHVKMRMAQLEEAILRQEIAPPQETANEINRSQMGISAELTRARTALIGFRVQEKELLRAISELETRLTHLESASHTHEALKRQWQLHQNNYLLYAKKQEEARISEALDREKVANVSLLDSASVPLDPLRPNRKLNLALGFVLALLISAGTVFTLGYFDPAVRTTNDIERRLSVPVIATIPAMLPRPKFLQESN